jgi:ankyrin repeat protein
MSVLTTTLDIINNNIFNNYELLEILLKNKILGEETKIDDKFLVEYIIINKKNNILELLIKYGFDINKEYNERSLLYISVWLNNINACKILLNNKANINYKRKNNETTSLYKAVENNYCNFVKLLLENDADININSKDGVSPIFVAITNNNFKIINMLLDKCNNINEITTLGITALYIASQYDYVDIVKLLLDKKADPNIELKNEYSLLNIVVYENNFKSLKLLLDYNINILDKFGYSLMNGIKKYNNKSVKLLIDYGYDINMKDNCGLSPLHIAIQVNNCEIVKYLLEKNIDINSVDDNNLTPLHICALVNYENDDKLIKILIESKADVNIKIKNNVSSITNPIFFKYYSHINKIIDYKIDYDIINGLIIGATPLCIAVSIGNINIIKTLLEAKSDPNIKLFNGTTCLYTSVYANNYKVLSLLLEYGANPDYPHDLISITNDKKCIKLLTDAKTKKMNSKKQNCIGEKCPICLEILDDINNLFMTKCYHSFHVNCWNLYNKQICPICRGSQ